MKRVLLLCLLLGVWLGAAPAMAQGIGAYFTLVNTYLYSAGPTQGSRILAHPRHAYAVVNETTDDRERVWYQVIYPGRGEKVSGVGWTPKAAHELLAGGQEPVPVFSRILDNSDAPFTTLRVPASAVKLLNESQPSAVYAQVTWQKVRYQFKRPLRLWARGGAGVYRPGKTAAFLSQVYEDMVTRNVDKELLLRLLSGVVRIGDDPRDVRWALGEPLRSQEELIGDVRRTTWQYPELVVHFENDVVKQID